MRVRETVSNNGRWGRVKPTPPIGIAELIRYARLRKGLSARALSLQAGLSPSYTGKLEAGEIEPSLRAFGRLVIALDLSEAEVHLCVVTEALSPSPTKSSLKVERKDSE